MDGEYSRHDQLETILQDSNLEPQDLSLAYLKKITNEFANELLLGEGGFGKVYKGVLRNGRIVAVKKLFQLKPGLQAKQFENEVYHLMKLKHPNIVRFVGYCYEIRNECVEFNGQLLFAEKQQRLLCLEYLSNGSLDRHLSDESSGLDWWTRYKIIKGVCCGIHYLHEGCKYQTNGSIIHLDLKPANILLDDNMVPKVADFGLSRLFNGTKTETCTAILAGTLGYMAPEYIYGHVITTKADIYSLGVLIIQIITGDRSDPFSFNSTSSENFLEAAVKKWRNRLKDAPLETDCNQIKLCLEIGLKCFRIDRNERPTAKEIIDSLNEWERRNSVDKHKLENTNSVNNALPVPDPAADKVLSLSSGREGGRGVAAFLSEALFDQNVEWPPVLSPPPPVGALAPPPVRRSFVDDYMTGSAWDIVQSFAPSPREQASELGERVDTRGNSDTEEENEVEDGVAAMEGELNELRIGETFQGFTGTSSLSTTSDDDASSTTTEAMFIISPNGMFKRKIKSWMRGALLGSGLFGVVYEGISDEGAFFAVKEVSLLDEGSNAQQSIAALEQEIALLSQFEHENIVQYYGTDKEESKLYIFIELVTQGSLSSLYQKYRLRESQVSAYTRQILNGLVYLHERNVVHRDIKCANILVHANGSVKLTDFGLAKKMSKIDMLRPCKGSVYWMAPEVINPKKIYGLSADIWSLGCTVLEMLTRQIPFPNVEWTNAFFMIGRGEQPTIPNYLSKEAQDFIGQCVRVDPESRPSASQLLEHPFVNRPLRASFESSSPPAIRL